MHSSTQLVGRLILTLLVGAWLSPSVFGEDIENRMARFGKIQIHYLNRGSGKEAVVFIHGWACNADFWREQMAAFPSRRLIAIDLPGHGKSDRAPLAVYSLDYFARAINSVMVDANVERAFLVGHSMGAPIAAVFYKDFPGKVFGVAIIDGAMRPFLSKPKMEDLLKKLKADYQATATALIDSMLDPVTKQMEKLEIRKCMLATPASVGIGSMEALADENAYSYRRIDVPVLAILADSHHWAVNTRQFLKVLAPAVEVQEWKGSHFLMMDEPARMNRELEAFMRAHASSVRGTNRKLRL